MSCDKCLELLSVRLDGTLTEEEERELEEHLAACPDCRAAGAQLAALQAAFRELEEEAAPEGFARGVMDRVRTEERKIVPLFRRPRFRALAGLAACAVLAAGLYGAGNSQRKSAEGYALIVRGFSRDAVTELADASDAPMYGTCTADQEAPASEEREYSAEREVQKAAPQGDAVSYDGAAAAPVPDTAILTLDRMPEGGWERIPTPVSPEGVYVTAELFKEIELLAIEQGITASITSGAEGAEEFVIIVLNGTG